MQTCPCLIWDHFQTIPSPRTRAAPLPQQDISTFVLEVNQGHNRIHELHQTATLFDDLVRATEQNRRHFQPYRLDRLQVDHKFELRRLLDSQLARIRSPENLVDIYCKPLE